MSAELVVLVPVLRRPQNVMTVWSSIRESTPAARVLFICDPDDREEIAAIHKVAGEYIAPGGNYAEKVNAGVEATDEPLIFLGADDLRFHSGWLEAAKAELTAGVGVVGTQDLCNRRVIRGEHATHFLLTREYAVLPTIDGGRGPLHEGYLHEFVDDELIGTARKRGTYAFAADSIVEHLHPDAGKAPSDELYAAQGERLARSRHIFEARRHLWT